MNTPNNQFDETRELLLIKQNEALEKLRPKLSEADFENMKSKNLAFFDLLYNYKPELPELESFLNKHGYSLIKNSQLSDVGEFFQENEDDICKGVIVFAILPGTTRMIFASKDSPISRAMKTVKGFIDKIPAGESVSET